MGELENHCILNVDDHAPARFLRTRILERAGYSVLEEDSAAGALQRAGSAQLIILDVKLPDADGISVCERVKEQHPDLPVVMITSVFRTAQARRDAFAAGADAYLLDPVEPSRLLRTVESFLKGKPYARPAAADETNWVITNADGHIEDLSDSAAELLNLSRRGAIGRSLPTYFIENRPKLLAELARASDGVLIDQVTTIHPRDRKPRRVRVDVSATAGQPGKRIHLRWVLQEEPTETSESDN